MEPEAVERLSRELAETRRHFDVVAEGVRADLQLVAEGVSSTRAELKAEIQQFRREFAAEFTAVRAMLIELSS